MPWMKHGSTMDFQEGLVDMDAYVIGPINLELAVLEMCLSDHAEFEKGYEE
jgi:hypothetical protein